MTITGTTHPHPFVTLSASYGAAGGEIGPAVARRLGVPIFDRAIAAQAAARLGISVDDPLLVDERPSSPLERLLVAVIERSPLCAVTLLSSDAPTMHGDDDCRAQLDEVIHGAADNPAGGVLVGHAGAVVLAGRPGVLHVRLDGPAARRAECVSRELHISQEQAAEQLRAIDRTHDAYVKQLYDADPTDPTLYHVILDPTVVPIPTCVELIAGAASALDRTA
jgi:cytidylate kinase